MVASIENFPDIVLQQLAYLLDPRDIFSLSLASKKLYCIFSNSSLWKAKTVHDFGNLFNVYTIFSTSTGLDLGDDLRQRFGKEPENWHTYYITKNASIDESKNDELMDQADKEYTEAQAYLKTFQNDGNIQVLSQVASKMIRILDIFPGHSGCYYILGFILFVLNQLEEAMILLQMGRAADPDFEPIDDLEEEIENILSGYKGDEDEPPLLDKDSLSSPLTEVLLEIFDHFDKDRDGALNPKELDSFIFTTNGSHPPPAFLRQMGQMFESNAKGWLNKDGFLVSLYGEPLRTWRLTLLLLCRNST
ncbi:hypothetical protein CLU79DRAFT_738827 [Phycomyces nitens]|nr:hypothetical protein CLU79DRAFT_738827 [Phycomyces nitens]